MRIFILGAGLLCVQHSTFAAEDVAAEHPIHSMNTIVVTASAQPENIHEALASIDVVDGNSLRNRFVRDLSDALDDRVGIQSQGLGLNRKGISIRGMNPEHTLYLVDGQRINSSSSAVAHSDAELNWIPAEVIQQVEVVRGPMSSLYGSEALGGVVNVITRKPLDEWQGSASLQSVWNESDLGGDLFKSSAYLAGPLIQDRLGISLWGEYRQRDALHDPTQHQVYLQDQQKNSQAHVGLFWQLNPAQQIEIFTDYAEEQRQDLRSGTRGQYYQVNDDIERRRVGLKHLGEWDWGKSTVQLYQTDFKRDSRRSDGGDTTSPQQLTDQIASMQLQFEQGKHQFIVGNELRSEQLKDPTVNQQHKDRATHYGIYLQDTWQVSDPLKIGMGLRGDEHEKFGWELSPKLSAALDLTEQWTLKSGIGRGFKAPTLKQLSAEFESHAAMGGRGIIRGNPDLQPETNTAYEIGLHFHHGEFESSLGWFQNDVDDLIETARRTRCDVAGKVCLDYVNIAQARLQGLEWRAAYQFEPAWHLETNYTYLDAQDQSSKQPLPDRAKHQWNTSLNWQATDQFSTRLRHHYRSRQFQAADQPYSKGYSLWHLYADYQLTHQLKLQAGIENFTDEKTGFDPDQLHSSTDAGRRYFLGLNARF